MLCIVKLATEKTIKVLPNSVFLHEAILSLSLKWYQQKEDESQVSIHQKLEK